MLITRWVVRCVGAKPDTLLLKYFTKINPLLTGFYSISLSVGLVYSSWPQFFYEPMFHTVLFLMHFTKWCCFGSATNSKTLPLRVLNLFVNKCVSDELTKIITEWSIKVLLARVVLLLMGRRLGVWISTRTMTRHIVSGHVAVLGSASGMWTDVISWTRLCNVVAFTPRLGWWRCWLWPSMRGSLPRLSSCRRGEFTLRQYNTDSVRNLPFLHTHLVFPHVSRFPGFIFPCLGVHPVQEVSPEQHRGACLQVDYPLISRSISDRLAIPSPFMSF